MRIRKIKGAADMLLEYKEHFIANPEVNKGKWKEVFGNDNPIYVEFGGGKGKFSTGMSTLNPNVNFIMVDMVPEVVLKAVEKAKNQKLLNFRLILVDINTIETVFEENEIDRIYLNFSDPWPKKRHYKRRLTYKSFLDKYELILKDQSWIHFKTDNRGLFQYSLNSFAENDMIMKNISLNLHEEELDFENVTTEYEEKFSKQGMPIYRVESKFRKK